MTKINYPTEDLVEKANKMLEENDCNWRLKVFGTNNILMYYHKTEIFNQTAQRAVFQHPIKMAKYLIRVSR